MRHCDSSSITIPIIDLAPLLSLDKREEWRDKAMQIRRACIEVGFLYLTNHGIEDDVIQNVFDGMKKLFHLHEKEKGSVSADKSPIYRGYNSYENGAHSCTPEPTKCDDDDDSEKIYVQKRDLKESFTLGAERPSNDTRPASPLHGSNQWPSESLLPGWRASMESYQQAIMKCMKAFMRGLALALDLADEEFFIKHTDDATFHMVLFRYHQRRVNLEQFVDRGCGEHTDCGFLTAVVQNDVEGLEVLTNEGQWIVAKPIPGTLVINLGDLLSRWSNDLFRSSVHRVRSPLHTERYSCVFFLNANFDALVECVNKSGAALRREEGEEEEPAHYPPIKAGHYLMQRLGLMWHEEKNEEAATDGDKAGKKEDLL